MPRVGLYQSWVASDGRGLDALRASSRQAGVEYQTLHDADIRAGKLRERFDAIVLPDQTRAQILAGHAPGTCRGVLGGMGAKG